MYSNATSFRLNDTRRIHSHLFASKYVSLEQLVPYLLENILSKDFLLRKVAISCLRQLCQKDSLEVCRIAVDYVKKTKPSGN